MSRVRRAAATLGSLLVAVGVLTASDATAYWTSISAPGGGGAAAATSVAAGATPTVSRAGRSVTLAWVASTLTTGEPVDGYRLTRYDATTGAAQSTGNGCAGVATSTTCTETGVPDGTWRYTVTPVVGTSWEGAESAQSTAVSVDATAPASTFTLTAVTGAAHLDGTTVYYRGSAAGSFRVLDTAADTGSGPSSSRTSPLGGTTTGWTHTPSTVSTPTGGPFPSAVFSWTAGATSSPTVTVETLDAAGNSTTTVLTFVSDTDAPAGTITYADGYSPGRSIEVRHTATSSGSPITGVQLQRQRASLRGGASGTCGTFGAFTDVGPVNPPSPYVDGPSTAGACYRYQVRITDAVGNTATVTGTSTARLGYAGAVQASPGLVSHWRFGEGAATSTDSFSGTAGVALQDRDGETGATWTRHPTSTADAVLTATGRIRPEATQPLALASSSGTPLSADYRVSVDVHRASVTAGSQAGVLGRLDATAATYYAAVYDTASSAWWLVSTVGGATTPLGSSPDPFPAGSIRRVTLDLVGSTVRVLVDGAVVVTATSVATTAAGRAGIILATGTSTPTDGTGLQLDTYVVGPVDAVPAAADARGTNPGTYVGGVALGQPGVLAGDGDTAARFDGVDDYMQVAGPTGLPLGASARTVELWFKTSTMARQVLYSYGSRAADAEFGLWLNPGGTSMTAFGSGPGDRTFVLGAAVNDGAWHQAVTTYDGTTLAVWIDGVRVGTQAATRATTLDSYGLGIGAVIAPDDTWSGGYFTGLIDEVAIYSTALSAATIADHYALANPYQDVDGPTGGSVDGANLVGTGGRYRSTTALTLALAKGSDPSGVAPTGALLMRATAPLSGNLCGAFSGYTQVAADPTASYGTTVTNGLCHRYRYVVPDMLSNTTTYASPTIKVDTSAPSSPTVGYSGLTGTYGTGYTVYYRGAAASGSVTLTGTATDTGSGVTGFTFPALGTGWTATPGATTATTAAQTYSWSAAGPAVPGAKVLTATNNAGILGNRTLTFVNDSTAPSGGGISYAGGRTTSNVPLTLTLGSDAGGSTLASSKVVQASTSPVVGGVCGTFGAFANLTSTTSTAASVIVTPALTADTCYRFQYVVSDRVGNSTVYPGTAVVRRAAAYGATVTGTSGVLDFWRFGETSGTTAADGVGANNPGTYVGGPALGVAGALVDDTSTAATFNGTGQHVTMNRGLAGTSFSLELWFRSTQSNGGTGAQWSNGAALVDADATGVANDFGVSLASNGSVVAGVGTGGGAETSVRSGPDLNDGAWHHVVFTRTQSGGVMVLYVDGVQAASATGGTATLTASTALRLAGSTLGGRSYAGSLDEVATYSAVLTAAQVAAHFNAGK